MPAAPDAPSAWRRVNVGMIRLVLSAGKAIFRLALRVVKGVIPARKLATCCLGTSYIPAIGGAIHKGLQQGPYWKPFYDGFPPIHDWLGEKKPTWW